MLPRLIIITCTILSAACRLDIANAFAAQSSLLSSLTLPARSATHTCLYYNASPSSGSGFGSKKKKSRQPDAAAPSSTELFELQELRAQIQTILKQDLQYQSLSREKRDELTKYVNAVVEKTQSPIDFSGKKDKMGTARFVAGVEGKSWRMVFSTDPSSDGEQDSDGKSSDGGTELPYGSSVVLRVGEFMGCEGTLDYVLKFSKQIMGLRELVAKSTCSVDVSST
jgi:hypothetical protein